MEEILVEVQEKGMGRLYRGGSEGSTTESGGGAAWLDDMWWEIKTTEMLTFLLCHYCTRQHESQLALMLSIVTKLDTIYKIHHKQIQLNNFNLSSDKLVVD